MRISFLNFPKAQPKNKAACLLEVDGNDRIPCREQGVRKPIGTGLFDPRQIQVALRTFSLALHMEYRWILEKDTGWRVEIGDWRRENGKARTDRRERKVDISHTQRNLWPPTIV
jgi:hypothetical protein